ncbi:MAG: Fmu (Sun) domain-containing protein [Ginsengibacter sp.]
MSSIRKENHSKRYLNYAVALITAYDGNQPFHFYLKKYFSVYKKHGSRDRKKITALCYNFFRLGSGATDSLSIEDRFHLATFLLEEEPSSFLQYFASDWSKKIDLTLSDKLSITKEVFSIGAIFPFKDELSPEMEKDEFSKSFLKQPKLFIRVRPGFQQTVLQKLNAVAVHYETITDACLSFSNNTKVSDVIKIDKEAVIQDYNSQRVSEFFRQLTFDKFPIRIWDCCAASGGKSILAYDSLKDINLTVSDSRKSILKSLHTRFAKAGIKNYHSFVADLSFNSINMAAGNSFNFIIADVPCSGSGTWARTPEQLNFFSRKKIEEYSFLQQRIVSNAVRYLADDGYLLYITCSVFKKENEDNVHFFQKNLNLELIEGKYMKGFQIQSDTLFAALFRK